MNITSEEKELTRKKIVDSARKNFRKFGYEKASMKAIANDVGIGSSTLYGYYSSKLDLFISAFIDVLFDYEYDYGRIETEMEKGFVEGVVNLTFSAIGNKIKDDREIIKSFYLASISSLTWSDEVKKRRNGGALFYKFIARMIDFYDSKTKSLCPFSRVEFKNTIVMMFEACAVEYILDSMVTEEMFKNSFSEHMRVLCAGKYEKY